jgi:hypothetical protein
MGCSPHKIQKQGRIVLVLVLVLVLETGTEKSDYENEDDDEDEINRQIKPMELNQRQMCPTRAAISSGLRQTRPKSMKPRWTSVWMSLTRTGSPTSSP